MKGMDFQTDRLAAALLFASKLTIVCGFLNQQHAVNGIAQSPYFFRHTAKGFGATQLTNGVPPGNPQ